MHSKTVLKAGLVASLVLTGAASAAEYRQEKSFDLAAGDTFSVKSEAGGVDVRGGAGAQAVIVITSKRSDFEELYDVSFDQSKPGRLEVRIDRRGRGPFNWSFGSGQGAHISVDLPRGVAVEADSSGGGVEVSDIDAQVRAKSSGGGVAVARVQGDVVGSSSGGGVEATEVGGGAQLESSGGSVLARGVHGDVDASSSGGGVRIEEAGGRVEAHSSGGAVRVVFAAGNAKGGSLGSSGGGVHARVDSAVGLEIDASSSGGNVDSDLPVTVRGKIKKDSLHGTLNGGGELLRLRSSGGGITIEER